MNGFRKELLDKIVGINGHIFVAADRQAADRLRRGRRAAVQGLRRQARAIPLVEGQAFASSPYGGTGVLVRGVRGEDIAKIRAVADNIKQGTLEDFDDGAAASRIGRRLAESSRRCRSATRSRC